MIRISWDPTEVSVRAGLQKTNQPLDRMDVVRPDSSRVRLHAGTTVTPKAARIEIKCFWKESKLAISKDRKG